MNTSIMTGAKAAKVKISAHSLIVFLEDGREIKVPLAWYPKLLNASSLQRNNFRLIGNGYGIHWPDIDEDLSIAGFLGG